MEALFRKKMEGFTLIEVTIAMGIFVIIMLVVMQIFGTGFKAYRNTRTLQHDLEQAQFATNIMAKEIRTSSLLGVTNAGGGSLIRIIDYSQNRCILYSVNWGGNGKLTKISTAMTKPKPDDNRADCAVYVFVAGVDDTGDLISLGLTSAYITSISSVPFSPGPGQVGKVTISLTFGNSSRPETLQTTVSLRDFNYVGI